MGNAPAGEAPPEGAEDQSPPALSEDADDVQVAATEIFKAAGVGAYHTSIIIGDREYYFDSQGIESAPPFWSHAVSSEGSMRELNIQVLNYGKSALTGRALLKGMTPFFEEGTYDVIVKNCNHFTAAALYFLTRKRLDPRFSRVERMFAATTPVSTGLINSLMRTAALSANLNDRPRRIWEYTTNPLAKDFTVEAVVSACDALDSETCPAAHRSRRWNMTTAACCARPCACAEGDATPVVIIPAVLDELPVVVPVQSPAASDVDASSEPELGGVAAKLERDGRRSGARSSSPRSEASEQQTRPQSKQAGQRRSLLI